VISTIYTWIRAFLALTGLVTLMALLLAFTGVHKRGAKWLATANYSSDCDFIALLPAGAIPGPTMLMRAYQAVEEYKKNPRAKIVISHKTGEPMEKSTIWSIREELILRGVPESAILLEKKATNTAEHARYIRDGAFGDYRKDSYLIVTSPTHVRRSVMSFKAAGFAHVYAIAAKPRAGVEKMGSNHFLRYDIWYSLMQEIEIVREFVAIAYYKISGRA